MKQLALLLVITIAMASCQQGDYYPERAADMKAAMYEKYSSKLKKAYQSNDYFQVGIQLANLQAPGEKVYEAIDKGIRADAENCTTVYEWNSIYKDFKNNVVKADTLRFMTSFRLCLETVGAQSYERYIDKIHTDYKERLAQREVLDTTKFDRELMAELEQINYDDQHLREKLSKGNLTAAEEAALWKDIKRLDSINLVKIEDIIVRKGYPQREQVGYDLTIVTWLVLHHQSDIRVRDKYQGMVEANCGAGLVEAYNWRSANKRLEVE